jgi:hypothetical protein
MGTVHQLALARAETSDQPIAPRRRVLMRAAMRVRGKDTSYPVMVRDISSTGLRASAGVQMFRGTLIELDLPNLGPVPGEVVRAEGDGGIGVRFGVVIEPERTQTAVTGSYGTAPSNSGAPLVRPI